MFSRLSAVLLIVLLGIFSFALLCVPAELPPVPGPQQTTDTETVIKSYGRHGMRYGITTATRITMCI